MKQEMPLRRISEQDLNHILNHTKDLWLDLDGSKLFITGGTGFFGIWLLESMWWAQKNLGVEFEVTVLSRSPDDFLATHSYFNSWSTLDFHRGDVETFKFPEGNFTHILHAATTSARATFAQEDPANKFMTIANGTRHVLDFARIKNIKNFWYTSSGSVYGKKNDLTPFDEDFSGAPDTMDVHSALGHGKRIAEYLCRLYAEKESANLSIARCFTFYGPYLPLDIHYAIGNFINDGLNQRKIKIKGDGKPVRSYLYAADMVIWLLTIFIKGRKNQPYNIGSEEPISILDLAKIVAKTFDRNLDIDHPSTTQTASTTSAPSFYLPSTLKARSELGLKQFIELEEGLRRTIRFYQQKA